ncbi:MAG: hypothetical protein ABI881_02385 [Betaproteobacteria bacterium]
MRWAMMFGMAACAWVAAQYAGAADPLPATYPVPLAIAPTQPAPATPAMAATMRVPYAPGALEPMPPPQRSLAVDREAAERLSVLSDPSVTFRLFVEGRGDARPAQPRPFERRFADTLNDTTAPPAMRFSRRVMDTTPCSSLASAGTPFGPAYRVYGFCP